MDLHDAHINELRQQLAAESARVRNLQNRIYKLRDEHIRIRCDHAAERSKLLDLIGPFVGPLTRVGGR